MLKEKKHQIFIFVIFALAVLSVPFFLQGNYLLNVLVFVGINTMLAVGLNLLLGYAGQIARGHAAFFGMGAYISGIVTSRYPVEPFLIIFLAAVCVGLIAFVIGFPILKLKGHYLAMATLGFGIIMYIIFNETVDWTGGPSGCLLYTSDAADDLLCVDLGGRRIIKKKKTDTILRSQTVTKTMIYRNL